MTPEGERVAEEPSNNIKTSNAIATKTLPKLSIPIKQITFSTKLSPPYINLKPYPRNSNLTKTKPLFSQLKILNFYKFKWTKKPRYKIKFQSLLKPDPPICLKDTKTRKEWNFLENINKLHNNLVIQEPRDLGIKHLLVCVFTAIPKWVLIFKYMFIYSSSSIIPP